MTAGIQVTYSMILGLNVLRARWRGYVGFQGLWILTVRPRNAKPDRKILVWASPIIMRGFGICWPGVCPCACWDWNVLRRNRRRPLRQRTRGLLADALFSQIDLHRVYGGVVPELAPRDHVKRMLPGIRQVLDEVRLHAGGYRRDRLYRRSWPGRRPAGGGFLCPGDGLRLGRWRSAK